MTEARIEIEYQESIRGNCGDRNAVLSSKVTMTKSKQNRSA